MALESLYFKVFQNEQSTKAPILLFHESLGSVELWRDFPSLLSKATGRDCIAYDRLGHGKSNSRMAKPGFDFIEEEANIWLPELLEQANVSRFVAYGHSVGGAIATIAAANLKEKCIALITEGTQSFIENMTLQGIRDVKTLRRVCENITALKRKPFCQHGGTYGWTRNFLTGA